jgi:hypothetical protein
MKTVVEWIGLLPLRKFDAASGCYHLRLLMAK